MRVTISSDSIISSVDSPIPSAESPLAKDLDTRSKIKLRWVLLKGRFLIGWTADEIYRTKRGFHLIWRNVQISEEESLRYRKILSDDKHRIELDESCPKKPKQVLFDEKKVTYYDAEGNPEHEETFKREKVR